nr:hypothetical protein [Tanacetum cinerariifolium]
VVVVAAAVVVTTTSLVRFMTVVIMTVAPVTTLLRGRLTPITTHLPEMVYVANCPEETSKSKEALHELRASF